MPEDSNDLKPSFTAGRARVHVEARLNCEGVETGSAWIGADFDSGAALSSERTPTVGAVVGQTSGVAAGCRVVRCWRQLELCSAAWCTGHGHETEHDAQRGLLVGGPHGPLSLAANVFDPCDDNRTLVLSVRWDVEVRDALLRRSRERSNSRRADVDARI